MSEPTISFKKLESGLGIWLSNVHVGDDGAVSVLIPWETFAQIVHSLVLEGFHQRELEKAEEAGAAGRGDE